MSEVSTGHPAGPTSEKKVVNALYHGAFLLEVFKSVEEKDNVLERVRVTFLQNGKQFHDLKTTIENVCTEFSSAMNTTNRSDERSLGAENDHFLNQFLNIYIRILDAFDYALKDCMTEVKVREQSGEASKQTKKIETGVPRDLLNNFDVNSMTSLKCIMNIFILVRNCTLIFFCGNPIALFSLMNQHNFLRPVPTGATVDTVNVAALLGLQNTTPISFDAEPKQTTAVENKIVALLFQVLTTWSSSDDSR